MSAESPRHVRSGGPLTVPSQPPSDRSIIDAVSGFINDVKLSSSSTVDPKDVIQWARFETADINEPTPEGDSDDDASPLLLILGYGSGVQVWLIPPAGDAQEVLSWRQGIVRVLRILPTPQHGDCFVSKRPLIALCDSVSPGPMFCSLSFISIRGGEQVKSIKFKNPILDVLANKRSVVVSFSERFAVFDAATLEDRMAVTTCYPCPCPLGGSLPVNPLALGERWLAYADKKLNQSKRSSGGCEGEGVTSYTATVLHAAKSLSKGLRGLGETVASSLSGGRSTSQSPSPPNTDIQQPGVVTILDIEGNEEEDGQDSEEPCDPIIAHFIAHSEAIIALKFDASGMLLVTADRRGHDFHVFRIHPHPCGPHLASVHHLYILHRGDTTAKVQDIAISCDARWAAVSTLRGTTHVFALSPYGGACGVRTHTAPRLVNRLSRFHRSAGLPIHAAAGKRQQAQVGELGGWFPNPRLPPYPLPAPAHPLAQLRPTHNIPTHTITRNSAGRQRLSSVSEEGAAPLLARAQFGPARGAGGAALYLLPPSGALLHLVLHPRPLSGVPKEKICDETPIELEVEAVAQWPLQRPAAAADLLAPLPPSNPLLLPHACTRCADVCMSEEERWLSQVEIVTHAGPHRRLWMGPQFVFKTYNCGSNSSLSEAETVEVETIAARGMARSNPVNMPGVRPIVPVLIDSGSASSLEHSPSDSFRRKSLLAESGRAASVCDVQLREDLAEAMKEDHGQARERRGESGRGGVSRAVDPLGTVVAHAHALAPPPPEPEPEPAVRDNADEDAFRPVLAAPAPLPPAPPAARPLPLTTTIPVQCARPRPPDVSPAPALELPTAVVIPAALGPVLTLREGDDGVLVTSERDPEAFESDSIEPPLDSPLPLPKPSEPRPRVRRSPTPVRRIEADDGSIRKSSRISEDPVEDRVTPKPVKVQKPRLGVEKTEVTAEEVCEPTPEKAEKVSESDKNVSALRLSVPREPIATVDESHSVSITVRASKKKSPEPKFIKIEDNIKTEEQAWDMLLNEPEKSTLSISTLPDDKVEEVKPKTKKNRKFKKAQEEQQAKNEEDTFVEIHAIEEQKPQPSELVSISTPFEDIEPSFLPKPKKSRSPKSITPERKDPFESKSDVWSMNELDFSSPTIIQNKEDADIGVMTEISLKLPEEIETPYSDTLKVEEVQSLPSKESPRSKKNKSLSPYSDRKSEKSYETEIKDVYVINTMKEEFPEIQITKGKRKKSPQPEKRAEIRKEVETFEKPIKSWSSIAACKSAKTEEREIKKGDVTKTEIEEVSVTKNDEISGSSIKVSIQEKLFEICKRTDIVVAECDAPSELNFVEEHHSVLDLPPLEPLDFGLDDFNLDVMRDSLLDLNDPKITSPICKINIDSILSTIKETTNRAIEASAFNLIDLEKVPLKREKGFSVVENDKISSQEVKVDDDKEEVMEKSSDDDNTSPIVSTDSDKEDKKSSGACNVTMPLSKQSNKNKKSRKKKK